MTVTGERAGLSSDLSPGTVTVIRPEDSEGEGKTVADLLEQSAGVQVVRLRGRGNYTVAMIRGSTAAQVAVYMDGNLMNSASESAVDLSTLPADSVERIEVYRGYIPARFGVSGMGAVISITTRHPKGYEGAVEAEGGSYGEWKLAGRYGNDLGKGRYLVSFGLSGYDGDFTYRNDNGTYYDPTDDRDMDRLNNGWTERDFLLRYEDDDGWAFRGEYYDRDQELPWAAKDEIQMAGTPGGDQETQRLKLALGRSGDGRIGAWKWNLSYGNQVKNYSSPIDPNGYTPSAVHNRYETDQWELTGGTTKILSPSNTLDLYLRGAWEELRVRGTAVDRYSMKDQYTQNTLDATLADTILLGQSGMSLVPTLRWNRVDDESKLSWSLALLGKFSESLGWRCSAGTYYRAPNMYEKYGDGVYIAPNEGLAWEKSTQWDAGLTWRGVLAGGKSSLGVTYFQSDADDLIEFVMVTAYKGYYTNIGRAFIRGVEVEGTYASGPWDLWLAYTYTDGENRTPGPLYGKPLPNRPKDAVTARLTRQISEAVSAFVQVEYVGENWFDQSATLAYEDLTTVDLGVKWALAEGHRLSLGVRDLFDESADRVLVPSVGAVQQVWYPDPGRTFYASYLWTF